MAVPTLWRTKQQRYNLVGEKCPACTSAVFPPRKVCPHCGETMSAAEAPVNRYAFSMPYQMPHHFTAQVAGDD